MFHYVNNSPVMAESRVVKFHGVSFFSCLFFSFSSLLCAIPPIISETNEACYCRLAGITNKTFGVMSLKDNLENTLSDLH